MLPELIRRLRPGRRPRAGLSTAAVQPFSLSRNASAEGRLPDPERAKRARHTIGPRTAENRLQQARLIGLVAISLGAATLAATVHAAAAPSAARCGGNLWRLKTLSDPGRRAVRLTPRATTIGAIRDRGQPRPFPTRRTTPFQRQTWEVVAQIVEYRRDQGELRLVLFDHGAYMNAAIPSPSCLPRTTRDRAAIVATWKMFAEGCGQASDDWQPLGAVVYVRGVGYWSQRRAEHRTASNGAELHPVTGFRAVAGCGS
jgi:hypothetical protein